MGFYPVHGGCLSPEVRSPTGVPPRCHADQAVYGCSSVIIFVGWQFSKRLATSGPRFIGQDFAVDDDKPVECLSAVVL